VHFKLPVDSGLLRIPANALLFESDGMHVAIVGADSHVTLKPVTPGRDFGREIEILSGVTADDHIVLSPPDSMQTGDEVRVSQPAAAAPAKTG